MSARSAYAGIGTKVVTIAVYMWCGLCAAIAGLIVTADIRGADANNAGLWLELDAILAVVIGGTSLFGGRFSLGPFGRRRPDHPGDEHRHPAERLPAGIQPHRESHRGARRASRPIARSVGRPFGLEGQGMIRRHLPVLITLAVFIVGYLICLAQFPSFASTRVIGNLLTDNAFLGIVAVGMTFVILSGGIDLSVGSVVAFTGVFLAVTIEKYGLNPYLAFVLILGIAALFGAGMGFLIHTFQIPAFIVTLAGMFLARGLCFVLTTDSIPINAPALWPDHGHRLSAARRRQTDLHRHRDALIGLRDRHRPGAFHALRRQCLRARRQQDVGGTDGRAGREDDGPDLHAVEFPCSLGRDRLFFLYIRGLLSGCDRRRARHDRGGRHRRHACSRGAMERSSARSWACSSRG